MLETRATAIRRSEIARIILGILVFILVLGVWAWLWVPPLPAL